MGHWKTSSSPARTNSSGVRTPRVKKAEVFRVGVAHSRADFRLDRMDGMIFWTVLRACPTGSVRALPPKKKIFCQKIMNA